jgi:hypothetical protein
MIIYSQETEDGLSEKISSGSSIAYASILEPAHKSNLKSLANQSSGSYNDADLYYVQ